MKLDDAVTRVATEYSNDNQQAVLDPSIILDLLVTLLPTLLDCMTSQELNKASKRPNLRNRFALNLLVRNKLGSQKYRQMGSELVKALFSAGSKTSVQEFESLRTEV